jgi:UDP-2-acetamido-3-amino-2,3-dideoxy-glucuronate N-acetyltransferase
MKQAPQDTLAVHAGSYEQLSVSGVVLISLVQFRDARGPLSVLGQGTAQLPFEPKRIFFTYEANEKSRGAHAHRECSQVLICPSGKLDVTVKDGEREAKICLDAPTMALLVPPMVWAEQCNHSPGAVLMVLASHPYDESDYIRDEVAWREALGK